jgi:hypothetical protein
MSKNIPLSPKHGVNPSVLHCEICGKDYGIGLMGKLPGDKEAPKDVAHGLCPDCENVINQGGVMIIEVRDGEGQKNPKNPYRTGRICGCSKQYRERNKIESPVIYMEQSVFSAIFGEVEFK